MPQAKFIYILLAELDFLVQKWWDSDTRQESYASWKLPSLSKLEALVLIRPQSCVVLESFMCWVCLFRGAVTS